MTVLKDWEEHLQSSILLRRDDLEDWIEPSHVPRQTRLEIYQNAYLLRLAEALQSNFGALYACLGEDAFGRMMLAFLQYRDPSEASIRWFGGDLSAFLSTNEHYRSQPWLADLAAFEWALQHTVDAADQESLGYASLAHFSPEEWVSLRLRLHPSVSLLPLEFNAPQIYKAAISDHLLPDPEPHQFLWLIHRGSSGDALWRSVEPDEFRALSRLREPLTFPDFCAHLTEAGIDDPSIPAQAASYLRAWVAEELLVLG